MNYAFCDGATEFERSENDIDNDEQSFFGKNICVRVFRTYSPSSRRTVTNSMHPAWHLAFGGKTLNGQLGFGSDRIGYPVCTRAQLCCRHYKNCSLPVSGRKTMYGTHSALFGRR